MRKPVFLTLLALGLGIAVFLAGSVVAAKKGSTDTKERVVNVDCAKSIQILPREVSKSLKISRIPTDEPIPLIVGTYWHCAENDQGFEICDVLTVVCSDDQSICTQIP